MMNSDIELDLFYNVDGHKPISEDAKKESLSSAVATILRSLEFRPDRDLLMRDIRYARISSPCLKGGTVLSKNMAGLGSLWGYFPHFMSVKVGGKSMEEKLLDPKSFNAICSKTADFCIKHEGGRVSKNRVLQSLKAYCGHHVSNFRPTAARDIFLDLVGANASIFDPCAGWGGRMIGAIACGAYSYDCIDASVATSICYNRLIEDSGFSRATIRHAAAEDCLGIYSGYDLAFTSPPYFNAEIYSNDDTQSCNRYTSYDSWVSGFLGPLCKVMADAVSPGGFVAINIADFKGNPMVYDTIRCLRKTGLCPHKEYSYELSSISGLGKKSEPVLVFRKRSMVPRVRLLVQEAMDLG